MSSESSETGADFEKRYAALSETERTVALLVGLMGDAATRTRVTNLLRRLDVVDEKGRRFAGPRIKVLFDRLRVAGLLDSNNKPHDRYIGAYCARALSEKRLRPLSAEVVKELKSLPTQLDLHRLRVAPFLHDFGEVRGLLGRFGAGDPDPIAEVTKLLPWLEQDTLPPELNREIDLLKLYQAMSDWQPAPDIFERLAADTDMHTSLTPEQACYLAVYALLMADSDLAQSIADRAAPASTHAQAMCCFFKGDYEAAYKIFSRAYKEAMRIGRERLDIVDAAFVLSALSVGKRYASVSWASAERQRPKYREHMSGYCIDVSVWPVAAMLAEAWQNPTDSLGAFEIANFSSLSGFHGVLCGLAVAWFAVDGEVELKGLIKFARTMEDAGFLWPAAEAAHALSVTMKSSKWRRKADELVKRIGALPFANVRREDDTWKLIVKRLDVLARQPVKTEKSAARKSTERLVWLLTKEYGSWSVEPRLQKANAKGWTKGRRLALEHLHPSNSQDLDYLTDHDRRICRYVSHEAVRSGWRDRYLDDVYAFEWDSALPELVGHPSVFRADALGTPVEVVKREVALQIERKQGRIRLKMNAPVRQREAVLEEESPSRFAVVMANPKHREIAEILGAGLDAPMEAKQAIQDVAARLASIIPVQSDVGAVAETLEIKADAKLHLHLMPHGDGLRLAARVRPLPDGPYFPPCSGGRRVQGTVKNKAVQAVRDYTAEKQRCQALEDACPLLADTQIAPCEWIIPEVSDCLDTLLGVNSLGDDVVTLWPEGERMSVTRACDARDLSLSIDSSTDWFEADGTLQVDSKQALQLRQLLELIESSSGRFVALGKGHFLALTEHFRRRLDDIASFIQRRGKSLRLHPSAALAFGELDSEIGSFDAVDKWSEFRQRLQAAQESVPDIPSTLQVELRDYQAEGFRWLARIADWGFGACLADDMGLGKTIQALALLVRRADRGPALVVAPASVCGNWAHEVRRFASTLNVHHFDGSDRERLVPALGPFDVLLCTYGLMQNEVDLLSSQQWSTLVLDESQAIKNPAAKRSKAAKKLPAMFRLAMSGTPIENHLDELWSLFDFLNPGLLGSLNAYRTRFGLGVNQTPEARSRLRRLIRPFILRRTKSQVLDELPRRTEITLSLDISPEEAALYDALRLRAVDAVDEAAAAGKDGRFALLAQLTKLRRACCSPSLVDPEFGSKGSKLEVFDGLLDELVENRHKALVFSQFVDYLHILRDHLDERGVRYQFLDGSTPTAKRRDITEAFQRGDGDVFLISLKAGGLGLNLTAASYVILMDPWWNPAVEQQASDRAHRIGQSLPVTIYRLVARGTIEEKVLLLHAKKRELADRLLDGAEQGARLSIEEIRALLGAEDG